MSSSILNTRSRMLLRSCGRPWATAPITRGLSRPFHGVGFVLSHRSVSPPPHPRALSAQSSSPPPWHLLQRPYQVFPSRPFPLGSSPSIPRSNLYIVPALFFALGCLIAGATFRWMNASKLPISLPRIVGITQDGTVYSPKVQLLGTLSAVATDGAHLFTSSNENGQVVLTQISIATGTSQILPLPSQIGVPEVEDISPDRTQLLLRSNLAAASQQPLWIVPIDGGSAFRVSDVVAQSATWMPDGRNILYASGNQLSIVSLENGRSTPLATVPGRAFWPRWSPDGKLLRFTIIDTVKHFSSLWEISKGKNVAHQILQAWNGTEAKCCGAWTADGKDFLFEATGNGHTDLWMLDGASDVAPVRLTNGPLNFKALVPGRVGGEIFFIGQDLRSRLERYDSQQKQYEPLQDSYPWPTVSTIPATAAGSPGSTRRRAYGEREATARRRFCSLRHRWRVSMDTWSADDTQLAFMARNPRQPWQIYTVSADGGAPNRLIQEDRNIGDPSFSPDGKYVLFGVVPELMSQGKTTDPLKILELATHRVTQLAHSEGMYSPRWSPDGRYIASLRLDQKLLMLYDTKTSLWRTLTTTPCSYPTWSKDGKSLYFLCLPS